jgi:23S rRNA pseudouridine1911/1915/1917 synthase
VDFIPKRLDKFLGRAFPFHSRTGWKELIERGEVLVNSKAKRGSYALGPGDEIFYFQPAEKEPEVNTTIHVVWEKDGVAVVCKPPNLPMHEGGAYKHNTFHRVLHENLGPEWFAIHRLDRETSGIVICANNKEARNALTAQMLAHGIKKTYYAIAMGKADIAAENGSAHIQSLCKWGPSTFTVRDRKLPSGRPDEETVTLVQADPTWKIEYWHFKKLCESGGGNIDNDIWINDVLARLSSEAQGGQQ